MSISFGEIYLYSHDPAKSYHFLSFLLDVEADSCEDERICFHFQDILFVIVKSDKKRIDKTKHFSLNVNSRDELNEMAQTIEFYHYKEGDKNFKISRMDDSLNFSDPDGRIWQINLMQKPLPTMQRNELSEPINQ